MDILFPILLGLVQATSAALAWMASKKLVPEKSRQVSLSIFSLALFGIGLTTCQAIWAKRNSEDSIRRAMGDPERPPYVSEVSLPNFTRFIVTNASNYPAYGIRIRLYDTTESMERPTLLRSYSYEEIPAHAALLDDTTWVPTGNTPERRLRADIATRTGVYWEDMILRQAGNKQWMRALRVMQGIRRLEDDIDSSWPRERNGDIQW